MSPTPLLDEAYPEFDPTPYLRSRPAAKGIRAHCSEPGARSTDHWTSHAAAAEMKHSGKAQTLRERIYWYLRSRGKDGATSEEISVALSAHIHSETSVTPRMVELEVRGLARKGPFSRTGKSGHRRVVFIATTSMAELNHLIGETRFRKQGHITKVYEGLSAAQKDEFVRWLRTFDAERVDRLANLAKGVPA